MGRALDLQLNKCLENPVTTGFFVYSKIIFEDLGSPSRKTLACLILEDTL